MKVAKSDIQTTFDVLYEGSHNQDLREKCFCTCENYKELLLFILNESDFLERYPAVASIIEGMSTQVARSALSEYDLRAIEVNVVSPLKEKLYEKQKEWANHAAVLAGIEKDINEIKKSLLSLEKFVL